MAAADFGVGTAANVSAAGIIGIFQEIKRHVRYVFHKKYLKNFEEKMELLAAKRESVRREVDAARRNLETILPDVQLWCERVDKTINDETKEVKDLEDRAKAKCFLGLCPNIKSRYQLSRKAEEYVTVVHQHLQQGQFNDVAVRDVPVASNIAAPKNYEAFDSRKEIFDQVVKALEDPAISMIGVYGTGGMGKTTLVREVARQVEKANLFFPVVLVTVTPNPNVREIQGQIAELLGLNFKKKNTSSRASLLSRRLDKEKNILIVLDDMWDELNLEEVGIRFGDQHKGCKILLTSRNRNVLTNKMDAEKIFPINDLEEEEAWELFKKMAGNDFENSDLLPVATEVVKKCTGLPLAIVTVARALKNQDLPAWRDALRQLQRPSSPGNFMPATVYSAIRLSYDNLEYEELKQAFLLCCLLVHNSHIEELLRFAMGLHLFEGVNTVEATRDRVLTMVSNLKDSCLLLDDYKNDSIAMHDFTRDVAIVIAREKDIFVLRDGDVFEDWPDEEKMQNFKMICLSFASIQELPSELECPQLTLFSMGTSGWNSYLKMPPGFFEKMKNIKVLNLIQADFLSSASASSISFPTSLRTLCLKGCRLGDIVSLGKLKNLEILSLSESNIERLPEETRQLTKLRSLDLTGCEELKIIPPGVLSSLSRLEELLMGGGVIVGWNQEGNARLYELKELLSRLTTLEICIIDAEVVKENFLFEKLQRHKIVIGVQWEKYEEFGNPRTLKLAVNTSIDHLDDGYKGLLKKTEALYLEDLKGVEIVLNQVSNRDCFLHLSHLEIKKALEVQHIMNDNAAVDKIVFRQLRSLRLENLPSLVSFCSKNRCGDSTTSVCQHDELPLFGEQMELPFLEDLYLSNINVVGRISHNKFLTLKSLTKLEIQNCDNLKDILSSSAAKCLAQLKSFVISGCKRLREIIFSEDIEEDDDKVVAISFPQLTTLRLQRLEHFIGFCSENYNIIFSSLKTLEIRDCPELKEFIYKSIREDNTVLSGQALFDEKVAFPQLEELRLENLKNCRKIWHNQLVGDSFSKLNDLSMRRCEGLQNVFPFNMSERLQNLITFEVEECTLLEEIFAPQILDANQLHAVTATPSIAEETATSFVFSKLTSLSLDGLPKLKSFYFKMHTTKWPSLKQMELCGCEMVEIIFASVSLSFGELTNQQTLFWVNEVSFSQLEKLRLSNLKNCKKIWDDQLIGDSFSKLNDLSMLRCEGLQNVFPFNMSERLQNLVNFEVKSCDLLEEIFAPQILDANELHAVTVTPSIADETATSFVFSKLTSLHFDELPKLKSFYSKMHTTKWPSLKQMMLYECDMVEIIFASESLGCGELTNPQTLFWVNEVSFSQLEKLRLSNLKNCKKIWDDQFIGDSFSKLNNLSVWNCKRLLNVFPLNMSERLQNLIILEVQKCTLLEEIFAPQILDANELHAVTVTPSIADETATSFVFSKLTSLHFDELPKLKSFYSKMHATKWPSLKQMELHRCDMVEIIFASESLGCGDLTNPQTLFWVNEVSFSQLEKLRLSNLKNCRKIWHDQLGGDSFSKLNDLSIRNCKRLLNVFPFNMSERLQNLITFDVEECTLLEEVFAPQILDANELHAVTATPSIAREAATSFVFSKLTSLHFIGLPKLKSFYSKMHTSKWPSLKQMKLCGCDMVEIIFASENLSFGELTNQQPLFWVNEVTFPNLEELKLKRIPRKAWHEQIPANVFSKLRVLELEGFPDTSTDFPYYFIQSLPNLEKLLVIDSAFSQIFNLEGFGSKQIDALPLTSSNELSLAKLPQLTHFWKKEYNLSRAFYHLRSLEVKGCGTLKNLLPLSVSFENLTTLKISRCHGIVNLVACSTAKSLVQLTQMSISDCEMIEEIIAGEGDELKGDIVFTRLKHLHLSYLPSLATFCFGKHNFDFPALEKVSVIGCPKMQIFSQGDLSTPMLQGVQFIEYGDKRSWEGNLNATIQWLFAEKIGFREIKRLSLSDSSKWIEIWRNPEGILCFKNLTSLELHDYNTLRCLFTVSIALDLPQLSWLKVSNCTMMQHIISDEEVKNEIVFPWLRSITLESCANLASFYQGSKILKCPSLEKIKVIDCPKMFAFASMFSRETIDDGGNTSSRLSSDAAFFDNKVEFPRLKGLMINRLGNCKKIWPDHLIDDSFSSLIILWVWNCDKLQNVFSLNMSHRLQNLMEFKVEKCDSLEEIFEPQVLNPELHTMAATESIVFASLEYLHLSYLPSLASFCSEEHNFEFPTLKKMTLRKCPKMKVFCKGDLSAPELQNVLLTKDEKIWRWEGNLKATIQRLSEEMNVQNTEDDDEDEDEDEDKNMSPDNFERKMRMMSKKMMMKKYRSGR